ncbi:MAG: hypothetical protein MHMPM18_004170 [Marteilia pararefringens]
MANEWDKFNDEREELSLFVMLLEILVVILLALTEEFKNGDIWIMFAFVLAVSLVFCAGYVLISSSFMLQQSQQPANPTQGYSEFIRCRNRYIAIWIIILFLCLSQFVTLFPEVFLRLKTENPLKLIFCMGISGAFALMILGHLYELRKISKRADAEERERNNHYNSYNNIARQSVSENTQNRNSEIICITDQNDVEKSSI